MGKRRNTAKTGDKAVCKGRSDGGNNKHHPNTSVDPMYDQIDQFHNERDQDFIRLGQPDQENDIEDRDLTGDKEAVLDLGIGGSSSSSESSDEGDDINVDDDDDDGHSIDDSQPGKQAGSVDSESSDESSNSDSGSDDFDEGIAVLKEKIKEASRDARNWGKKTSSYYHGDTADLEIGQQEEDAFLEEEAAKEIQAQRFQEMDEDDFVFSDDESNTMKTNTSSLPSTKKQNELAPDFSKLSTKEARKFLQHRHPELLPMVAYFADVTKDLKTRTEVASKALFDGEDSAESVGATLQGQEYLLTKAMLQKSIALNAVVYLLLKSTSSASDDGIDAIQAHPITDQLKSLYSALEKLEKKVIRKNNRINEQMDYLVKAAVLMNGNEAESGTEINPEDGSQDADSIESDENDAEKGSDDDDCMIQDGEGAQIPPTERHQQSVQRTLNEARFGLRLDEAKMPSMSSGNHTTLNKINDYVDPEEEASRSNVKMLASTINSIEQRVARRSRRPAPNVEQMDDPEEHDDRLGEGIKLMEAELCKLDNEDGDGTAGTDDAFMDDPDANDESLDFYQAVNKKTKSKKALRKSLYQVAPKFPRNEVEVDGERAINRTILKNRGLVAHKAKINRNPRVKKREQYRKALIRRKGAVREVRERESHNYGGEGTGIKSGISRSRKLSNKS